MFLGRRDLRIKHLGSRINSAKSNMPRYGLPVSATVTWCTIRNAKEITIFYSPITNYVAFIRERLCFAPQIYAPGSIPLDRTDASQPEWKDYGHSYWPI